MKINKIIRLDILLVSFFILAAIFAIFLIENKSDEMARIRISKISKIQELTEPEKYQKFASGLKKPTRKINITINDQEIMPSIININRGEKILFNVYVSEGLHNFIIDEDSILTKKIPTDKNDSIYFIATKSGKLKFYSKTGIYKKEPEGEIIINE